MRGICEMWGTCIYVGPEDVLSPAANRLRLTSITSKWRQRQGKPHLCSTVSRSIECHGHKLLLVRAKGWQNRHCTCICFAYNRGHRGTKDEQQAKRSGGIWAAKLQSWKAFVFRKGQQFTTGCKKTKALWTFLSKQKMWDSGGMHAMPMLFALLCLYFTLL